MSSTTGKGFLAEAEMAQLIVAILVKRLGGAVEIRQEDLDHVAFLSLMEDYSAQTGVLQVRLIDGTIPGQG